MLNPDSRSLFPLAEGITYLNHGGFGVAPKEVLNVRKKIQDEIEKSPLYFFDKNYTDNYYAEWSKTAARVARRFGTQPKNLALVDNVTDGITAVLRSLRLKPGDEILTTSWTYGAIKLAAKQIADLAGARVHECSLRFPNPDPEQCITAVEQGLTVHTKLAILDHIASGNGIVLPIEEMTKVCRDRGVPVLIDGAHAPGQVALDIDSLSADFYIGNLHKWYWVPRACGFLCARPDRHENLFPNVLSWEIEQPFPERFSWTGTRDPSAWLSIPAAFEFMDRLGEENVRRHNRVLIREGIKYLAEEWGTSLNTPDDMIGSMALVPLPETLPFNSLDEGRLKLQRGLKEVGNVAAIVPFCDDEGLFWIRLSAQIYNDMSDFEKLAETVRRIQKNGVS
jgi:isopenicillin-N epimerase